MTPERQKLIEALAIVLGISCLAFDPPAAAQNLLGNGDFDDNQQGAGWSLVDEGSLIWLAADRDLCPDSGDLLLQVSPILRPEQGSYTGFAWSDCIVLPNSPSLVYLSFDWSDNSSTTAGVVMFPDSGCADLPTSATTTVSGSDGSWNRFEFQFNVAGSPSVRVEIGFFGAVFNSLILDRVYLGVRPEIFLDGFGGGSTCRWNLTSP